MKIENMNQKLKQSLGVLSLAGISILLGGCNNDPSCSSKDFVVESKGTVTTPSATSVNGSALFCSNKGAIPTVSMDPVNLCSSISMNCVTGTDGNQTCDAPPTDNPGAPAGYVACSYSPGPTPYCATTFAMDCIPEVPVDDSTENCEQITITNNAFTFQKEVGGTVKMGVLDAYEALTNSYYIKGGGANSKCTIQGVPTDPSCTPPTDLFASTGNFNAGASYVSVKFNCSMASATASYLTPVTAENVLRKLPQLLDSLKGKKKLQEKSQWATALPRKPNFVELTPSYPGSADKKARIGL